VCQSSDCKYVLVQVHYVGTLLATGKTTIICARGAHTDTHQAHRRMQIWPRTHTSTHTISKIHKHTLSLFRSLCFVLSLSLSLSLACSLALLLSLSLPLSRSLSLSLSVFHSHTHKQTLSLSLSITLTHVLSLSRCVCFYLSLSRARALTLCKHTLVLTPITYTRI